MVAGNPTDFVESITFPEPNVGATLLPAPNATGLVSTLLPPKLNGLFVPADVESDFGIDGPPKLKALLGPLPATDWLPKMLFVLVWLVAEKLKVDDAGLAVDDELKILAATTFFSGSVLFIEFTLGV